MTLTKLNFSRLWTNTSDYPTIELEETKVREDLQSLHDETKDYLNEVLSPEVEAELEQIKNAYATKEELQGVVLGQVPDNSITAEKLDPSFYKDLACVYVFDAGDWDTSSGECTLTISAEVHKKPRGTVLCQASVLVEGRYVSNAWAAVETYATMEENGDITLRYPESAGYTGRVMLFVGGL